MVADRVSLIGLGATILMATAALAQNTTNPVLSGQSTLSQARSELRRSSRTSQHFDPAKPWKKFD
jgi:hypothetical protein